MIASLIFSRLYLLIESMPLSRRLQLSELQSCHIMRTLHGGVVFSCTDSPEV